MEWAAADVNQKIRRIILKKWGEYFLQIKANQPTLLQFARNRPEGSLGEDRTRLRNPMALAGRFSREAAVLRGSERGQPAPARHTLRNAQEGPG